MLHLKTSVALQGFDWRKRRQILYYDRGNLTLQKFVLSNLAQIIRIYMFETNETPEFRSVVPQVNMFGWRFVILAFSLRLYVISFYRARNCVLIRAKESWRRMTVSKDRSLNFYGLMLQWCLLDLSTRKKTALSEWFQFLLDYSGKLMYLLSKL